MTDRAKIEADAELVAETVARRCSTGTKRDGSPSAPTRHAIIWQAARLGALEYAKMTRSATARADGQESEIDRLRRLVDAYRLQAVNEGWNHRLADAYGRTDYLHNRIVHIDKNAERTVASGYDASAYLRDGLAKVTK